ncbi:MAG: hypothetical protein ACYTGL_19855 [Planctomycetota bacterium]|jgi:type II secretory pathway component PulK
MKRSAQPYCDLSSRRGVVLVVVLVIVAMVAFAGFSFVASMSTEYEAVKLDGGRMQSEQTLASAEALIQWYVDLPPAMRASAELDAASLFRNVKLDASGDEVALPFDRSFSADARAPSFAATGSSAETDNSWRFTVVSGGQRAGSLEIGSLDPLGTDASASESLNGAFQFGPENESGRLNLALLLEFDAAIPGSGRESLIHLTGMTPEAADSLLDWIDADDAPREFGAEADDYQRLPQPYRPRNGIPETVEELLFVRGIDRQSLFGHDANRNFRIDASEGASNTLDDLDTLNQTTPRSDFTSAFDDLTSEPVSDRPAGWSSLISLHSAERNVDPFGQPRINLNHINLAQLHESLLAVVPEGVANFVILMRQYGPSPVAAATKSADSVVVDFDLAASYSFNAVGDLIDQSVTVNSGSEPVQVASPVTLESEPGKQALRRLLSHAAITEEPLIQGRININAAPRSVLRAIPGIAESSIDQLIARRDSLDADARQSTAWLLEEDILTVEQFRNVQPWLTTGGDVYRCQAIAFRPLGGPVRRMELVVGPTASGTQRLFRRSLTELGGGFSKSLLMGEL